jgi:starch phosphorylase
VDTQGKVDQLFGDKDEWTRKTILNTANMGKFSSDRAVLEYAREIWGVQPLYK